MARMLVCWAIACSNFSDMPHKQHEMGEGVFWFLVCIPHPLHRCTQLATFEARRCVSALISTLHSECMLKMQNRGLRVSIDSFTVCKPHTLFIYRCSPTSSPCSPYLFIKYLAIIFRAACCSLYARRPLSTAVHDKPSVDVTAWAQQPSLRASVK